MIALICLVAAFIVAVLGLLGVPLGSLNLTFLWFTLVTASWLFGPVGPPAPFWRRDPAP
jgi:hypothetical protein